MVYFPEINQDPRTKLLWARTIYTEGQGICILLKMLLLLSLQLNLGLRLAEMSTKYVFDLSSILASFLCPSRSLFSSRHS